MEPILSTERAGYISDYQRLLEAELRDAQERASNETQRGRSGRGVSTVRRALSRLIGTRPR